MACALGALHVAVGERHLQVLVHGEVVEQVVALEDEPDVLLLQLLALLAPERVHLVAEELVLAGEGAVVHAEHVQQRRLARARTGP